MGGLIISIDDFLKSHELKKQRYLIMSKLKYIKTRQI